MTATLVELIETVISRPEHYWPGNGYFERRNRSKIERSLQRLSSAGRAADLGPRFADAVRRRRGRSLTTLYAMSNGSSGCHYLGNLLAELPGFVMTDEVYFPVGLLEDVAASDDDEACLAIDFVNLLHTGSLDERTLDSTIVNIGHLRSDVRPEALRSLDRAGTFLLLLRNPYDVATSRAFRKQAYRDQVASDVDDDTYLRRQASYTANFLRRARQERWDHVIRYEQLRAEPTEVLVDLFLELGLDFDIESFRAAGRKHDAEANRQQGTRPSGSNLNLAPRMPLTSGQAAILRQELGAVAKAFSYAETVQVKEATAGTQEAEVASPAALWLPTGAIEEQYTQARYESLLAKRVQVFRNQPWTDLEDDPTWTADPIGSKTWRLYYHSLAWLLALEWGIDHGPRPAEDLAQLEALLDSYLATNVMAAAVDEMAWDDHAAADRLAILCRLYARHHEDFEASGLASRLQAAITGHAERMIEYAASGRWAQSNHGVFHAMALLDAAVTLEEPAAAARARVAGAEYLETVIRGLVDPDEGIAAEQSIAYHSINLHLLRQIRGSLAEMGIEIGVDIERLTASMVDFNLAVRTGDNHRPAIGDSPYGKKIPLDALDAGTAGARQSTSTAGTSPAPLIVYPNSGLALLRSGEPGGPGLQGVFVFHAERRHHGHYDALNVLCSFDGRDLLIDSGGPYAYGDRMRFSYFVASRAHNTVLVDGQDHQGGATLLGWSTTDGVCYAAAEHTGYDGHRVRRSVALVASTGLAVFDSVASAGEASYQTLWHLPPGAETAVHQPAPHRLVVEIVVGDARFGAVAVAGAPIEHEVVSGVMGDRPQGWVTTDLGKREPAPVIVAQTAGHGHRAVTWFGPWDCLDEVDQPSPATIVVAGDGAPATFEYDADLGVVQRR